MIPSIDFWLNLTRVAVILLTLFLAWVTYQSNQLIKTLQPDFNLLLSLPEMIIRLVLVGICLLLAWLTGLPAAQLGLDFTNPLPQISLGLAVGIGVQIVVNLLVFGLIKFFDQRIYSPWLILNILPRRPVEWLLLPLALIPAVTMEELLFRTLWLGAFSVIIPLPILIIGTSILFGLMHMPQGFLGVVIAAGLNIVLCLLFVRTGGLLAPLIAHYTINLLQVVVAHFERNWLENY